MIWNARAGEMILNALRGGGKTIWNGLRLRSGHLQRKDYFYFAFVAACGPLQTLFSQEGLQRERQLQTLASSPSQALTRQLSQRESPWHSGKVTG